MSRQRANYGIDAPPVITLQLALGVIALAAAAVIFKRGRPPWTFYWGIPTALGGLNCLANAVSMLWYSKVGKLRLRERLLDQIRWRGDEQVLETVDFDFGNGC